MGGHRVPWAWGTPLTVTALKLSVNFPRIFQEWLQDITTALLGVQVMAGFSHGGDASLNPSALQHNLYAARLWPEEGASFYATLSSMVAGAMRRSS